MNYFFGFDNKLTNNIDWFFNLNHLFLILFVAGIVLVNYFLLRSRSEKGKKITKLCLASILLVLEVGRTVYKYMAHTSGGGTAENFNWWWNISFQMCAIMCWTTIITLVLSAFLKKENKFLQVLYNILFGCAMIGGVLTFCYPDCMSADYPFLHFINIQTVVVHALLIFVPIYLIGTKDFKVEIKNVWQVCVGYVYIGCVAMTASLISGNNFAYSLKFDLFDLGLPFPWHLPVLLIILTAVAGLIYGVFELVRLIKRKINKEEESKQTKQPNCRLEKAIYVVSNVCAILFGALIMLGSASLIGKDAKSLVGLVCLIALAYMILLLVFAEKNKHYIYDKFDRENKTKHITLIVLTMIFALPVGILYLIKYLGDKNDISGLLDK